MQGLCNGLTLCGLALSSVVSSSISCTNSIPLSILPNTTCLPSRCGVGTVVMKNCEPFVPGPALAMLNRPGRSCCKHKCVHIKLTVSHSYLAQHCRATLNRPGRSCCKHKCVHIKLTVSHSYLAQHWPCSTDLAAHVANTDVYTLN